MLPAPYSYGALPGAPTGLPLPTAEEYPGAGQTFGPIVSRISLPTQLPPTLPPTMGSIPGFSGPIPAPPSQYPGFSGAIPGMPSQYVGSLPGLPPSLPLGPTPTVLQYGQPTYLPSVQGALPTALPPSQPAPTAEAPRPTFMQLAQGYLPTQPTEVPLLAPGQAVTLPEGRPIDPQRQKERQLSRAAREVQRKMADRFVPAVITEIFFTLASDVNIDKEKIVYITNPQPRFVAGVTKLSGTLYDPAMGPSEIQPICSTCTQDIFGCPGHFGAIQFREGLRPDGQQILMYHPYFFEFVIYLMQAICRNCSNIVLSQAEIERRGIHRRTGLTKLTMLAAAATNPEKPCWNCRYVNNKILVTESKQSSNPQIMEQAGDSKGKPLPIKSVWAVISRIDPDAEYLRNRTLDLPKSLLAEISAEVTQFSAANANEVAREQEIARRRKILSDLGYSAETESIPGTSPRAYILQSIYVLPPKYRMARYIDGELQPHKITVKYSEMLRKLMDLGRANLTQTERENAELAFITKVRKLYVKTQETGSSRHADKNLRDIFDTKHGLLRKHGLGKPVGQSARSVIDPGPSLPNGTVSIPRHIAEKLSLPVTVTARNISLVQELLTRKNAILSYRPRGSLNKNDLRTGEDLVRVANDLRLQIGDSVSRSLMQGDRALLYRAPTLSKLSIASWEIEIHHGNNILIGLQDCESINGDYDGDEVSLAVPQSLEAQIEGMIVANKGRLIMSARTSDPAVGPFYDAITAAVRLTNPKTFFTEDIFFNALAEMDLEIDLPSLFSRANRASMLVAMDYQKTQERKNALRRKMGLPEKIKEYTPRKYTGRLLFSATLPPDFEYTGPETIVQRKLVWTEIREEVSPGNFQTRFEQKMTDIKERVRIRHGILLSGVVYKSVFGIAPESIVAKLTLGYSIDRARLFINNVTKLLNYTFSQQSVSVSVADLAYDEPEFRARILEGRVSLQREVRANAPPYIGFTTDSRLLKRMERHEATVYTAVQNARAKTNNIVKETFGINNAFGFMGEIGAKGNLDNASQMIAGVGQSSQASRRIEPILTRRQRCSPWFAPGDYDADARGYCFPSFMEDPDVADYALHHVAGRESLVLMSNSTAKVGFLRRKLVRSTEPMTTQGDFSNRVSGGVIVSYIYGGTGFDTAQMRRVQTKYGTVTSFVNCKELAATLNSELGF